MSVPAVIEPEPDGLAIYGELRDAGAITDTALVLPPDMPYERYEALGAFLGTVYRTAQFMLGDWINYGEKTYKDERYLQAAGVTGLSEQTLMNYASICKRVPRSRRRRGLGITTHDVVASLPPAEQEEWLRQAASNGWTRAELREHVRPSLPPAGADAVCVCPHCGDSHEKSLVE